jgi:DNA-binding phage protein
MDNTSQNKEAQLLSCMKEFDVPLKESVALLCRLKGITFKSITKKAGYTRNGLYQALNDSRKPKRPLYQSVIDHLGVDPWAVYEDTGDNGATRE